MMSEQSIISDVSLIQNEKSNLFIIEETPEKLTVKRTLGPGGLLPEFQLLLKRKAPEDAEEENKTPAKMTNCERPKNVVCSLIEKFSSPRPALSTITTSSKGTQGNMQLASPIPAKHNKRPLPSAPRASKKPKYGKINSGVGHGIRKPKSKPKQESLKQSMFLKLFSKNFKKDASFKAKNPEECLDQSFESGWETDESQQDCFGRLHQQVDSLLENLEEDLDENETVMMETDNQLKKISELIELVQSDDAKEYVREDFPMDSDAVKEVEELLDRLLGCEPIIDIQTESSENLGKDTLSDEELMGLKLLEEKLNTSTFSDTSDCDPFTLSEDEATDCGNNDICKAEDIETAREVNGGEDTSNIENSNKPKEIGVKIHAVNNDDLITAVADDNNQQNVHFKNNEKEVNNAQLDVLPQSEVRTCNNHKQIELVNYCGSNVSGLETAIEKNISQVCPKSMEISVSENVIEKPKNTKPVSEVESNKSEVAVLSPILGHSRSKAQRCNYNRDSSSNLLMTPKNNDFQLTLVSPIFKKMFALEAANAHRDANKSLIITPKKKNTIQDAFAMMVCQSSQSGSDLSPKGKNSGKSGLLNLAEISPKSKSTPSSPRTSPNVQLFPLFNKQSPSNTTKSRGSPAKSSPSNNKKLPMQEKDGKEQLLLDAGQKKFGMETCITCGFLFDPDVRKDVETHIAFHNRHSSQVTHLGWKNERVVADFKGNGKIILVKPSDPVVWWKRIATVLETVNHDLGFIEDIINFKDIRYKAFLYIYKKNIVSCLIAEDITSANKMLPHNGALCTEESFPATCGVSRIWTSSIHRKKGFAVKLMNALRLNFFPHRDLKLDEIAFSSPSLHGRAFAAKYFRTQEFLIVKKIRKEKSKSVLPQNKEALRVMKTASVLAMRAYQQNLHPGKTLEIQTNEHWSKMCTMWDVSSKITLLHFTGKNL